MSTFAATINATEYPPHLKHKVIFEAFAKMSSGEAMLLVNDHDPVPLRRQLESANPGQLDWSYLQQGPAVYQVKIGKI